MNELVQLQDAITQLEKHRALLGDSVVNTAVGHLRRQLAQFQAGDPATELQRKLVTVLFADVSGFTAMSETMDPETVRDVINDLWGSLDAAIINEGGLIDKHMGDAVMALFGAPIGSEDDAERAIRAGLALQRELEQVVARLEARFDDPNSAPRLRMRVGINTGLALCGTVGTNFEYTAMGDTVNVANRLETAAPLDTVLISYDTQRHVQGIFELVEQDPIRVKGKSEAIQTFVVKGIRPREFRVTTRGMSGIETPMIGRDEQLAQIQDEFLQLQSSPHVFTVVAEAGIGKSRLLYEFSKWLEAQDTLVTLYRGRATEDMELVPYAMIRTIFGFLFDIQDSDRASEARAKLEAGLVAAVGDNGAEYAPFIGHLMGYDYADHPLIKGILDDAKQIRDRAFNYISQVIVTTNPDRPAILMLEDIHWIDEGTLEFIAYLIEKLRNFPLMVICATRATLFERRSDWGEDSSVHSRIDLDPLDEDQAAQLIGIILQKAKSVPVRLRNLIIQQADGNPFYIEEMIKMLIDGEIIVTGDEVWEIRADRLAEFHVPPTLTGVLQARLDRLPATNRRTLQKASVVGRKFWDQLVVNLHETDDDFKPGEVISDLPHLQEIGLVYLQNESSIETATEYTFNTSMLREVTYETVLMRTRPIYHFQVANWMINHTGDRVGDYAGRIGEHLEQAREQESAAEWYARAAKQAQDTYALTTAVGYYTRAIPIIAENQRTELMLKLGEIYQLLGQWADASQLYDKGLALAEKLGDKKSHASFQMAMGEVLRKQGHYPDASEWLTKAQAQFEKLKDQVGIGQVFHWQGTLAAQQGDLDTARSLYQQSLEIRRTLDDKRNVASLLSNLGIIAMYQGDYFLTRVLYEEGLEIRRELSDRWAIANSLDNLGYLLYQMGELDEARTYLEEAVSLQREIGGWALANALNNLGNVVRSQGSYETARMLYEESLSMSYEMGSKLAIAYLLEDMGCMAVFEEKHERGLKLYGAADTLRKEIGAPLPPDEKDKLDDNMKAAFDALGKKAEKVVANGAALSLDEAVDLAFTHR